MKKRILTLSFDDGVTKEEIRKEYLYMDSPSSEELLDTFRQFLVLLTYEPEFAQRLRIVSEATYENEFKNFGFFDKYN